MVRQALICADRHVGFNMTTNEVFLDGDFPVKDAECKYYCSPTCHPAQIGPKWVYGCLHPSWPQNKDRDFCPIVKCGGILANCELPPD